MYFVRIPGIVRILFPNLTWRIPTEQKILYLTFDDGPHPEITGEVLSLLTCFNAHATFFCLGKNARNNPALVDRIRTEGHAVGNHGYEHLNGWRSTNRAYYRSYLAGKSVTGDELFRPPYGRLRLSQSKAIRKNSRIIMWDVLCGDFDADITKEKCLSHIIRHSVNGSIIVFHDTPKARINMLYALEGTLKHFSEKGYRFETIA